MSNNRDRPVFAYQSSIPREILHVVTSFYRLWEMPETPDAVTGLFNPDGVLHILDPPVTGQGNIRQFRARMVELLPLVEARFYPNKLYLLAQEADGGAVSGDKDTSDEKTGTTGEVMVDGRWIGLLHGGQEVSTDFVDLFVMSRAKDGSEELKLDLVRSFWDTSKMAGAVFSVIGDRKLDEGET
ncbi:hypothetical protein BJX70DRAFT_366257, partial [Aspergillus crustosus]